MKTDHDIETLLTRGKELTLSSNEKAAIKTALLQHASTTLQHERRAIPSPFMWLIRSTSAFAVLLIVFVGTGYASQDSLPGETLYLMKVHVVEDMIGYTKTDPHEHLAYELTLMETRLTELQVLAQQEEPLVHEDLITLSSQIDEHVSDITETLKETETVEIPHEEKIKTLSKLSSISKAQVEVTQGDTDLSSITEVVNDTQETTTDSLASAVHDFAEDQSNTAVTSYLSDQISIVSDQIQASTTDADTRDDAENHLHNVDESLNDGNTTDALISVLKAQQTIETDAYLDAKDTSSETTNAPK